MAPSLPDLIWVLVFKKLKIKDQLTVWKMSPRGAQLVRAANRYVKTIVIYSWINRKEIERTDNTLSFASTPSMKLALAAGGDQIEPYANYLKTHPSKWVFLKLFPDHLLDLQTIEFIVSAFSAVTDLKFAGTGHVSCKNLTTLLQHPQWRHQLTRLMIHWPDWPENKEIFENPTTTSHMISAINDLSILQCLVMNWDEKTELPVEMTIFARLKMFVLTNYISSHFVFMSSINHHAAKNDSLKVILFTDETTDYQIFLNNNLSSRLIRFLPGYFLSLEDNLYTLCAQLSSLISIHVAVDKIVKIVPLFTALAQLSCLVHLELNIFESKINQIDKIHLPVSSLKILPSIRALDLSLLINSHTHLNWINLKRVFPRLKAIHVLNFHCYACNVSYINENDSDVVMYTEHTNPNFATVIKCFRATLDQLTVSKMSLRGAQLVRAANRHVSMVIVSLADLNDVEKAVNQLSLASTPSMQLALAAGGDQVVPFDDYPKTTVHPSKWAFLKLSFDQLLDPETIESIVNTFSAVTDLKFIGRKTVSCKNLTALLQHSQWRHQLTRLWIHWPLTEKFSDDQTTVSQMITAINNLSTLKCLAMIWSGKERFPVDLSIIKQLETFMIIFKVSFCRMLQPSLDRYAANNENLKLFLSGNRETNWPTLFNKSFFCRIVRFFPEYFWTIEDLQNLCRHSSLLTSISVCIYDLVDIVPVFNAFAKLPHLVHLELWLDVTFKKQIDHNVFPMSFLKPMPSVRALDLKLYINSHTNLNWLNLEKIFPCLQAIHVYDFYCYDCEVSYMNEDDNNVEIYTEHTNPNFATANACFRNTLGRLHSNVSYNHIIIDQLTVSKMSLRGAQLVRAANRHVTTMVIDYWSTPEEVKKNSQ
ncbi:hypothetical protein TYRP_023552 [Tyrophagus putrescentiae]|nr:hypothetical protein TYRP_023552 [Tyrophagus putrescentiae]